MVLSELDKFIIELGKAVQNEILSHRPSDEEDTGRLEG